MSTMTSLFALLTARFPNPYDHFQDVTHFAPVDGHTLSEREHLRLLSASESQSEHPIGKVIHAYAQERLDQGIKLAGQATNEGEDAAGYPF